jgi:hypothetical protein
MAKRKRRNAFDEEAWAKRLWKARARADRTYKAYQKSGTAKAERLADKAQDVYHRLLQRPHGRQYPNPVGQLLFRTRAAAVKYAKEHGAKRYSIRKLRRGQ